MSDKPETTEAENEATQEAADTQEPQLSQEDMRKELERARKDAAKYRTQLREKEEAEKKARMTAEERAKAERQESEQRAQDAITRANQRLITADAKVLASQLGANPDRIAAIIKNTDLTSVDVDDDGNVDGKALRRALEATLREYPEWKAGARNLSGGSNPAAEQDKKPHGDMNTRIRRAAGF